MAAMSTSLTEFATLGDSRTYTTTGHSASRPKLVIQKRKVPVGNQTVAETSVAVIHATEDADGALLPSKVSVTYTIRYPVDSGDTALANALTIAKDLVASDEMAATALSLNFLK